MRHAVARAVEDYRASRAGLWRTCRTAERLRTMTRIRNRGGSDEEDTDATWRFGLAVILGGVERPRGDARG